MITRGICLILTTFILSCNSSIPSAQSANTTESEPLYGSKIISPKNLSQLVMGKPITFNFQLIDSTLSPDSLQVLVNQKLYSRISISDRSFTWSASNSPAGINNISIAYYKSGKIYNNGINLILLSDIAPKNMGFKVLKTYKHDINSYTQGLIYDNGVLFESAGLYNQSSVRKVAINGDVLLKTTVDKKYFAEGLTLLNGLFYQITWREQTAFVYKKEDLSLVRTLQYPIDEGWGLTNDGKNLIMSDGSEKIYTVEPENFSIQSHIEVYDQQGSVTELNELELVGDKLYANIYQTNRIAVIEPQTGRILAYVDLTGLLTKEDYHTGIDVLNGIAYNPESKHFYITGKNWPKLFEGVFFEK